jgi:hypothetical protein
VILGRTGAFLPAHEGDTRLVGFLPTAGSTAPRCLPGRRHLWGRGKAVGTETAPTALLFKVPFVTAPGVHPAKVSTSKMSRGQRSAECLLSGSSTYHNGRLLLPLFTRYVGGSLSLKMPARLSTSLSLVMPIDRAPL